MELTPIRINCQVPVDGRNVERVFNVIECSIQRGSEEYNACVEKARQLAEVVNAGAANHAEINRLPRRRVNDAIMGVLAEEGWLQFINSKFDNIAEYTPFEDPTAQIDIQLSNGEMIEIRSSFVRNGVKFGICHDRFNFKNIGPYSNTIKPGEVQKDLYLAVLFDTPKDQLLNNQVIRFTLVGGSTWEMMERIGFNNALTPEDDLAPIASNYRVIQLKNTLDAGQIIDAIAGMGYERTDA